MVASQSFQWEQGEDLTIDIQYNIGGNPADLTGYEVRMDIALGNSVIHAFNSDDFVEDPDRGLDGPDAADNEIIPLSDDGKINIVVSRELTLKGPIAMALDGGPSVTCKYDLFIRNADNRQRKLLQGEILINRSVTLWQ